jgi:hypothetical protein
MKKTNETILHSIISQSVFFLLCVLMGAWVSQQMKDRVIYKGGRGSHKDRYILAANMFPN